MQAILDACQKGTLNADPCLVISNRSKAMALERAKEQGIANACLNSKTHPEEVELDQAILTAMQSHNVNLIVLAGYLRKLGDQTIQAYRNRIINIHPSLLPKFGGQGMYGHHVHKAVIAAGEKESGATIHLVDEEYDHGGTLAQMKVSISKEDTAETLAAKILPLEHKLFVNTLIKIANQEIELP